MLLPRIDSEQIEISTTLIKILRNQVIEMLKQDSEIGYYISSVEDVIKEYYTPYLVSLFTNSFKDNIINVKALKYNFQYMIAYFIELHKYSMIITEYGVHHRLKNNETIEIEKSYEVPIVVNTKNPEMQEFAEKLIEALGFNKRVNLAFLEKILLTKIDNKAFRLTIKHSYQIPATLVIPILSSHEK